MADENGAVTDKLIAYHAARAKGGCVLNIVEVAAVIYAKRLAHFVSISEDHLIEGHRRLDRCDPCRTGKRESSSGRDRSRSDPKAQMLVVSDMSFGPYTLPAITKEQIREVIACYGKAAARAVEGEDQRNSTMTITRLSVLKRRI